jgi:three-Cys-motif partner protein
MAKKDVKKNLLNHSEAKVKLLGEYLKRYLNIICNDGYTENIEIYDLFCGEGLYKNGGEGSPMVIMRAIKDIHFINAAKLRNIPKINCFFNDIDSGKIENLKKVIHSKSLYYKRFGELSFDSIDYKHYLVNLENSIKKFKNEKAFIFIDPYEYKHIKISHIKKLLAGKKSEVLLWLPTQFMYRFEKNGTPKALKDLIEEIVPYKEWKQSDSVWRFVDEMKAGFQKGVGDDYFVDHFTIQKDRNTVFCLFFFTSHIKGYEKMLESKWQIDDEFGKGWNYSGNQNTLFSQQKTNPLEEKLLAYLSAEPRMNGDVFEFTLRQGFLPKHTNEIFTTWQQNGKLEVILSNGKPARKRAFYIAYKYYKDKNEYQKVTYKLK